MGFEPFCNALFETFKLPKCRSDDRRSTIDDDVIESDRRQKRIFVIGSLEGPWATALQETHYFGRVPGFERVHGYRIIGILLYRHLIISASYYTLFIDGALILRVPVHPLR